MTPPVSPELYEEVAGGRMPLAIQAAVHFTY